MDVFEKNAFKFTKKQTDKVNDLLDLIDLPIIEILQDQDDSILTKKSDQITCIHCRSSNIQFMQNNRKSFSVGKAVGGAALTGGIGTLAGFAGKKGKDQWFCQDCNTVFEI